MGNTYSVAFPRAACGIVELVRGGVNNSTGGHPPHWHSDWQLVAVTRGDGWVRVRGTQHQTPGGSLFLIPPEVVHSNDVFAGGCDFRSILIEAKIVESIAKANRLKLQRNKISEMPVVVSKKWTDKFDQYHFSLEQADPALLADEMLDNWITSIISYQTGQNRAPVELKAHSAAIRAREFLADHAHEAITLKRLASTSGMSGFELSRQFKAAFGLPPHAWLLQVRIDRSKALLKTSRSICEVATELGFSDQAHFTRIFRRTTGYTPGMMQSEFRKIIQDD